jgi:hypothetical protein
MKIAQPKHNLIEYVAGQLAGTWYEIGRSQGLTSKYKDAKSFARANIERFIPNAVQTLLQQLHNPDTPKDTKDMIYDAIMERHNDPDLIARDQMFTLPDVDIKKVLDSLKPKVDTSLYNPTKPEIITTVLHNKQPIEKVIHGKARSTPQA